VNLREEIRATALSLLFLYNFMSYILNIWVMKKEKYESQLRLHQIAAALGLRVKDLFKPID